jgi:hypothetical protein
MENIFEKLITTSDYFLHKTKLHSNNVIKWNLHDYLYEYLNKDITLESDEKKFEYVLEFLKDIDRLNEVNDELGFNVFKTLNIVNTEIRHSNVLAWLFDPNETHQLKDLFFKNFIQKIYLENQEKLKNLNIEQLSQGLYILNLQDETRTTITTKKMLKIE